jgi:hypothetical protein
MKRVYREAFLQAGQWGACDVRDTIVIAGSPRSGTTWLIELLHLLPGYKALNEPLLRKHTRDAHGFYTRTYIAPDQPAPQQHDFLHRALSGQLEPSAQWLFDARTHVGRLVEHQARRKVVVKFCRINRMLDWFGRQFDVRGIVLIVRHPCAVVNSMLQKKAWDGNFVSRKDDPNSSLWIEHLPESVQEVFAPVLDRITTHTEALAAMWSLDQYIPLVHDTTKPWLLIPYERLVIQGFEELNRLSNALGVGVTEKMEKQFREPSASVNGHLHDPSAQLRKWKDQLTSRQVDDILRVVDDVGLSSIYTEASEPSYQQLEQLAGKKG